MGHSDDDYLLRASPIAHIVRKPMKHDASRTVFGDCVARRRLGDPGHSRNNLLSEGDRAQRAALLVPEPRVAKLFTRDRKSTRLNSSHIQKSRMPSSA